MIYALQIPIFVFLLFGIKCLSSALQDGSVEKYARIQERFSVETPTVVRKMSDNPCEVFLLDYWQFLSNYEDAQLAHIPKALLRRDHTAAAVAGAESKVLNSSAMNFSAPFLPHSFNEEISLNLRNLPRDSIFKRGYQCPTGTNACTSIGEPNSCCATNQVCMMITDTGLGSVGCCPAGQSCAGSISTCNTAQGYTSCPGSPNGGCCIPNYTCDGNIGCKFQI